MFHPIPVIRLLDDSGWRTSHDVAFRRFCGHNRNFPRPSIQACRNPSARPCLSPPCARNPVAASATERDTPAARSAPWHHALSFLLDRSLPHHPGHPNSSRRRLRSSAPTAGSIIAPNRAFCGCLRAPTGFRVCAGPMRPLRYACLRVNEAVPCRRPLSC